MSTKVAWRQEMADIALDVAKIGRGVFCLTQRGAWLSFLVLACTTMVFRKLIKEYRVKLTGPLNSK